MCLSVKAGLFTSVHTVLSQLVTVNREVWDKKKMICAVRSVRAGQMGDEREAKQFNVLKDTLERYVKDNTKSLQKLVEVNLGE
jgi:hypothetical protein